MSSPDNNCAWLRKLSRMVRLTLFLNTAVFTAFLEIASPSRAYRLPFLRARIINCESLERQDVLKTLLKSAALFSLFFRWKRRRSGDTDLSGQALPAFGSARLQYLPPGFGAHANAKTVTAFPLDIAGLVCTFHWPFVLFPIIAGILLSCTPACQ